MKLVILGVIGVILGLSGGTGAIVMKHRRDAAAMAANSAKPGAHAVVPPIKGTAAPTEPAEQAEPAPTDSAPAAAEVKSEKTVVAAPKAALKEVAVAAKPKVVAAKSKMPAGSAEPKDTTAKETAAVESVRSKVPPVAGPQPSEVRPADTKSAASADPADRAASFKQLARIFGNMKASDAVKVMAFMSDDEVDGVIRQFAPRQAAELLANFPKERAAVLSRRLLSPPRGA